MRDTKIGMFWWMGAPILLAACVQIVGIEDPLPIDQKPPETASSSGAGGAGGGTSNGAGGSSSSGNAGPWVAWPMPNPAAAGLPNPSNYSVDDTKGVVIDKVTGLMWQQTTDTPGIKWNEAKTYCENLEYGGYTDWRLPWRIELVSLIDYTKDSPAIDAAFPNTPIDGFWSATIDASNGNRAWFVWFEDGDTYTADANVDTLRARCVR